MPPLCVPATNRFVHQGSAQTGLGGCTKRGMESTKKTELVVQDRYTTPPGFGAKQASLRQSAQARERRNR